MNSMMVELMKRFTGNLLGFYCRLRVLPVIGIAVTGGNTCVLLNGLELTGEALVNKTLKQAIELDKEFFRAADEMFGLATFQHACNRPGYYLG